MSTADLDRGRDQRPLGQERQPGIPITIPDIVADGIAAVEAGAAIVHLHVYDVETGRQRDDWELYAQAIEGIRAKVDAIVYPTIPIVGSGYAGDIIGSGRYTHLEELAKRGLVEWGVLDPGSCNWTTFAGIPAGEPGFIYQNPGEHIREGMEVAQRHKVHPSYAIYEPGFTRLGAALAKAYPGHADADLPADVLRRLRLGLSAARLGARRASEAAGRGCARARR